MLPRRPDNPAAARGRIGDLDRYITAAAGAAGARPG